MKKEIDTYKVGRLFDAFKSVLVSAWYSLAACAAAALWFFPIPPSRIQVFVFIAFFIVYTLLSVAIAKVEQTRHELS